MIRRVAAKQMAAFTTAPTGNGCTPTAKRSPGPRSVTTESQPAPMTKMIEEPTGTAMVRVAVTTIYMYVRSMEFEWDEAKNRTNIRKHGIGFETAKLIFEGTVATSPDRRRDYGEDRRISIGRVEPGALIVVTHTERRGRIRLISARPASRKERRVYNERTLR